MPNQKLYIKNMVCHRCKLVVESELKKLHLNPVAIELGEVTLEENGISNEQKEQLKEALEKVGFELMDDKKSRTIEKIKSVIINAIHHKAEPTAQKFSQLITDALHYDYPYLSRLFTEVEGITIEHYIIQQKIEKVKEYLIYDELSLSQIAFNMGYSSTAHLSTQFKKVTGLTPSQFKAIQNKARKPLDQIQ